MSKSKKSSPVQRALDKLAKNPITPLPTPDQFRLVRGVMESADKRGILPKTDAQSGAYGRVERFAMKIRNGLKPEAPSVDGSRDIAPPHVPEGRPQQEQQIEPALTGLAVLRALDSLDELVGAAWRRFLSRVR